MASEKYKAGEEEADIKIESFSNQYTSIFIALDTHCTFKNM
jgi:hypothetical protein